MKAIRFVGAHQPAEITDVPEPRPGPGEVVVAVGAAGLCHSDLHILDGSFPVPAPMTLGHEVAGRVLEVGAGADGAWPTGTRFVLKGTLQGPRPGLGDDGGLAERVLVPASYLMPIPDGIGMGQAAVATESVATAYHAVKDVGGVRLGETVGIIGLGGLGLNAVSIAAMAGAWGSKRQELAEVLDLIAAGRISSVLEEISLDEVPEGYARLHRGEVPGRLVAMIDQADGHNRKQRRGT